MNKREIIIEFIDGLLAEANEHDYTKGYEFVGALHNKKERLLELESEQYAKDASLDHMTENQFNGQV
jgi:hypothetical protein